MRQGSDPNREEWKVAVIGGGLAGYAAAVGLASQGVRTVLIAPEPPRQDRRSTALIGESVAFLTRIGVFQRVREQAAPLMEMRIVDDTARLLRAPTLTCRAGEIGLSAFGFNVLNADLMSALKAEADELTGFLTVLAEPLAALASCEEEVALDLGDGRRITARLAVGADGGRSIVREQSGIPVRDWTYPQSAIVLNFAHSRAHDGISTEFHRRTGPFTQVPLPGRRSSLVWVEQPDTAEAIMAMKPEALAAAIETRLHSILGTVEVDGSAQSFPLKGALARRLTSQRVALIGEAAHVFPPIGAQGLNLGLRDAAAVVAAASGHRDDPGCPAALHTYAASRRTDVRSRSAGVDLLNRSLLADILPAQAARAFGLSAMASVPFLRRFAMREGLAPGAGLFGISRSTQNGIDWRERP